MDLVTLKQFIEAILLFVIILQTIILLSVFSSKVAVKFNIVFICSYSLFIVMFSVFKGWL